MIVTENESWSVAVLVLTRVGLFNVDKWIEQLGDKIKYNGDD